MDAVLAREKPEAAIVMIGTNDISGGQIPPSYRAGLEQVIGKCLAANCVPILNTIPPRRGREKAVEDANKIIRDVVHFYSTLLRDGDVFLRTLTCDVIDVLTDRPGILINLQAEPERQRFKI